MPSTLTHKLPAKPSWSNSRKEPVKSLPASAETVEESERRKKPATVSGLMFGENPPFGTKIVLDEITEREGAELLERHRARFLRKLLEERSQESTLGSSSDESIKLDGELDLDNDIETANIHGTQGGGSPTFNTDKALCRITTRDLDDDSDDDLPPLNRLLEKSKRKSPEDGLAAKDSVEESAKQVLNNDFGSQESRAGSSNDEPIEILGNSKLALGEDLHTSNSPRTQNDERSDDDPLDVESPVSICAGLADDPRNSINNADTDSSSGRAKRVRFASPCNAPSLGLSTPPHSWDGDGKRSMMDTRSSDYDESRDGTAPPKRQKLSLQDVETAVAEHNVPSPPVISDVDSVVGLESLSDDDTLSNADIPTPTTPNSAIDAPRICPQFVDINQEWEYRRILGEEVVGGALYYEMEWRSSLIPKASVRNDEVIAEYEARKARARACGAKGKRRGRPPALNQGYQAVTDASVPAGHEQKRPRGRPRKVPLVTVC